MSRPLSSALLVLSATSCALSQDSTVSCIERKCGNYQAACLGSEGCTRCLTTTQSVLQLQCADALLPGDRGLYNNIRDCTLEKCSTCTTLLNVADCVRDTLCLWQAGTCTHSALSTSTPEDDSGRCCLSRTTTCTLCTSFHDSGWCAASRSNCELTCKGTWCAQSSPDCTTPEELWDAWKRDQCCTTMGKGCTAPSLEACGCTPSRPETLLPADVLTVDYVGDLCVGAPQSWGAYCYAVTTAGSCEDTRACCNVGGYVNTSARCRPVIDPTVFLDNSTLPVSGTLASCGCSYANSTSFVPASYIGDVCVTRSSQSRVTCSYVTLDGRCSPDADCCNANGYTGESRVCGRDATDPAQRRSIRVALDTVMGTFRNAPFVQEVLASTRRLTANNSGATDVRVEFVCPSASCCYGTQADRLLGGCALGDTCAPSCDISTTTLAPCVHNCTTFSPGANGTTLTPTYQGAICQSLPQSWGSECTPLNADGACNVTDIRCIRNGDTDGTEPTQAAGAGHMTVEFSLILNSAADEAEMMRHVINEVNTGLLREPLSLMQGSAVDVISVYEGLPKDTPDGDDGGDPACGTLCIVALVVGVVLCCATVVCIAVLIRRSRMRKRKENLTSNKLAEEHGGGGDVAGERVFDMDSALDSPVALYPNERYLGSEINMGGHPAQYETSLGMRPQHAYGDINTIETPVKKIENKE